MRGGWLAATLLAAASPSAARGPDSSSVKPAAEVRAPFLAVGAGARAAGLGETFTAVADDASAVSWNPAGLGQLEALSAVAQHDVAGEDVSMSYGAVALPVGPAVAAVGVTALSYGTVEVRDRSGAFLGTESPLDVAAVASVAAANPWWFLGRGWTGVSLEAVKEEEGDTLLGVSAGGLVPLGRGMRVGAALQHFGPATDGFGLPAVAKAGWHFRFHPMAGVMADGGYPLVSRQPWGSVGAELFPRPEITLRVGYRWRQDHTELGGFSGVSMGAGLRPPAATGLAAFSVDYAYQSFGELMASHRVALVYDGSPRVGNR